MQNQKIHVNRISPGFIEIIYFQIFWVSRHAIGIRGETNQITSIRSTVTNKTAFGFNKIRTLCAHPMVYNNGKYGAILHYYMMLSINQRQRPANPRTAAILPLSDTSTMMVYQQQLCRLRLRFQRVQGSAAVDSCDPRPLKATQHPAPLNSDHTMP